MATVADCQPSRLVVARHRASLRGFVSGYLVGHGDEIKKAATGDIGGAGVPLSNIATSASDAATR
jgi:hypothetical protein